MAGSGGRAGAASVISIWALVRLLPSRGLTGSVDNRNPH